MNKIVLAIGLTTALTLWGIAASAVAPPPATHYDPATCDARVHQVKLAVREVNHAVESARYPVVIPKNSPEVFNLLGEWQKAVERAQEMCDPHWQVNEYLAEAARIIAAKLNPPPDHHLRQRLPLDAGPGAL